MSSTIECFDALCHRAMDAYDETIEGFSYEDALVDILEFIKAHPDHRAEFVERFKRILTSHNSPFESVAFCMRELRWPEILEFVDQSMQTSTDLRSHALMQVWNAYQEEWDDADVYQYYNGRK